MHANTPGKNTGLDAGMRYGGGAIEVYAGFTDAVWLFA